MIINILYIYKLNYLSYSSIDTKGLMLQEEQAKIDM